MEIKLSSVYIRAKTGLVEYKGGPTLMNGFKKCLKCSDNMELMPIGQPFIRNGHGKILVDNIDGVLILNKSNPKKRWMCNCGNSIRKK